MSQGLDFVLYTIDERSKILLSHGTGETMKPVSMPLKASKFSLNILSSCIIVYITLIKM